MYPAELLMPCDCAPLDCSLLHKAQNSLPLVIVFKKALQHSLSNEDPSRPCVLLEPSEIISHYLRAAFR